MFCEAADRGGKREGGSSSTPAEWFGSVFHDTRLERVHESMRMAPFGTNHADPLHVAEGAIGDSWRPYTEFLAGTTAKELACLQ